MDRRWLIIWLVVSVLGGLFFTLLSGLYSRKPNWIIEGILDFGFPFVWMRGYRFTQSWLYSFFWGGFLIDFIIYGILTSLVVSLGKYLVTRKRKYL